MFSYVNDASDGVISMHRDILIPTSVEVVVAISLLVKNLAENLANLAMSCGQRQLTKRFYYLCRTDELGVNNSR